MEIDMEIDMERPFKIINDGCTVQIDLSTSEKRFISMFKSHLKYIGSEFEGITIEFKNKSNKIEIGWDAEKTHEHWNNITQAHIIQYVILNLGRSLNQIIDNMNAEEKDQLKDSFDTEEHY